MLFSMETILSYYIFSNATAISVVISVTTVFNGDWYPYFCLGYNNVAGRPLITPVIYRHCKSRPRGFVCYQQNARQLVIGYQTNRFCSCSKIRLHPNFLGWDKVGFPFGCNCRGPSVGVEGIKWSSVVRDNCGNHGGRWRVRNNQWQVGTT